MKKAMFYLPVLLLLGFGACVDYETGPEKEQEEAIQAPPGWSLVWHDEFDRATIDPQKWEFEVNAWGGGNNELQYYTDRSENARIEDGRLVIEARREAFTGPEGTRQYTSARLRSMNRGDWKYGRIEVRAKLPQGQGIWPAIWMLPTDWTYGGWPRSGEIDLMELLGHEPNKVHGTLHYTNGQGQHRYTGTDYTLPSGTFASGFHVFALEWEANAFRWYVDGHLYQTQTQWTGVAPYPAPFDQRFHLLLNLAVGGNWPGNPNASTVFPQQMVVDYVRVFEKEDA